MLSGRLHLFDPVREAGGSGRGRVGLGAWVGRLWGNRGRERERRRDLFPCVEEQVAFPRAGMGEVALSTGHPWWSGFNLTCCRVTVWRRGARAVQEADVYMSVQVGTFGRVVVCSM